MPLRVSHSRFPLKYHTYHITELDTLSEESYKVNNSVKYPLPLLRRSKPEHTWRLTGRRCSQNLSYPFTATRINEANLRDSQDSTLIMQLLRDNLVCVRESTFRTSTDSDSRRSGLHQKPNLLLVATVVLLLLRQKRRAMHRRLLSRRRLQSRPPPFFSREAVRSGAPSQEMID